MVQKGLTTLTHGLGGGRKMVLPPWKAAGQFLRQSNIESPHCPAIPLPGVDSSELKPRDYAKTSPQISVETLFVVAKEWGKPECPSTRGAR